VSALGAMLLRRAAIYTVWQKFRTVKKCQIFDNYDFFWAFHLTFTGKVYLFLLQDLDRDFGSPGF
jgi:hypothetical protein